jgi:hypothetical protein
VSPYGRDRPLTDEQREAAARGVQAARAILHVRRGPRGARTTCDVACPWCGAARFEPCLQPATGRPLLAMHPARVEAMDTRDDHLDAGVPWPLSGAYGGVTHVPPPIPDRIPDPIPDPPEHP